MDVIYWVIIGLVAVGLAALLVTKGYGKGSRKKGNPPAQQGSGNAGAGE